jgi:hypothetical protein
MLVCLRVDAAHADFTSASVAYDRKDFPAALREFERLAEEGEADAEYNLALMLVNGDGVKKDLVTGYGWALTAEDNGLKQATGVVDQLRRIASPAQTQAAQEYVTRYGRESMMPPHPELFVPAVDSRPHSISQVAFTFPDRPLMRGIMGWVDAVYVIGTDGQIHDTWSGSSIPPGTYDESVHAALVHTRFEPAMVNGKPTAVLGITRIKFVINQDNIRDRPRLIAYISELKKKAESGDSDAQFALATIGWGFPELAPEVGDRLEWRAKAAAAGHILAEFDLGLCKLVHNDVCDSSPTDGVRLLAQAARKGSGTAVMVLALVCSAEGTIEGDTRAIRWLQIGASKGQGTAVKYLADFLASSPHDEIRDAEGAERLVKRLRESALFKNDPDVWQISSTAAAASHNFQAALAFQDKAIERAAALGWDTAGLRDRRAAYASQREQRSYMLGTRVAYSHFTTGPKPKVCEEVARLGSRLAECY